MDTRFWGPSGWRFLHLIATAAPDLNEKDLHDFFTTLPFALPCKFCRASLSDYIQNDPVPTNKNEYAYWLYRIHNRVNAKLREQGLIHSKDPKWIDIRKLYENLYNASCTQNVFLGWDFLYSTAYVSPCPAVQSAPMPNAPPIESLPTPELRNRWSLLSRKERLPYLERWWNTLGNVLPYKTWRDAWKRGAPRPDTKYGRGPLTRWLYKMEEHICSQLHDNKHHTNYTNLCSELSTFSSNCGKRKVKIKTCRAVKSHARQTLKTRRQSGYKLTGGFL